MSILTKFRIFNKYKIIIWVVFCIGLFTAWFFLSGMFELTILFDKKSNLYSIPALEAQKILISEIMKMDNFVDTVLFDTTIYPILIFSMGVFFIKEKKGAFQYQFLRGHSYKKVILISILTNSIIAATAFYLGYIFFMTIGFFITNGEMSMISRNIFDGLFGHDFSRNNTYFYYILEGFYKYFISAFFYTLLVCSIILHTAKSYTALLISMLYYFGLTFIIMTNSILSFLLPYQPTYISGFSSYVYNHPSINTALSPLLSILFPLIISFELITSALKRREKVAV